MQRGSCIIRSKLLQHLYILPSCNEILFLTRVNNLTNIKYLLKYYVPSSGCYFIPFSENWATNAANKY